MAIGAALKDVQQGQIVPVPVHLRDKHYQGAERLGHGAGYVYSHEAADGVADQDYLGVDRTYYQPTDRGWEATMAERLAAIRARFSKRSEERSQ